jgi:hypothetical protein
VKVWVVLNHVPNETVDWHDEIAAVCASQALAEKLAAASEYFTHIEEHEVRAEL